jgi:predicted HicB family RNase H-like nuclease
MMDKDLYTYRVSWSKEDDEYVGQCLEFASLSWLAQTPEEAFAGIRWLVADVLTDMETNGEIAPEPFAGKQFSGKFLTRVPPELHRQLALEAAEAGVSLNRLVSDKLSRSAQRQ